MKIAVLSDIHSNYHAFTTCVNYALEKGIDHFLFLGDYVSDCAYPQKTMKLLYDLKDKYHCWFIKGNREEYMLNHRDFGNDGWKSPSSASGSLLYTYENLSAKDFDFFESLNISGRMKIKEYPDFLYCHGSMDNTRGDLMPENQAAGKLLADEDVELLVCGHVHRQRVYEHGNSKIVNVGSVGVPWDYHGDAQFGILNGNKTGWDVELIQLEYDKEKAVAELYESGLNDKANIWAKLVEETLLTGVDRSMECLQKALEKCEKEEGTAEWSKLSERYWEEAAEELSIYYYNNSYLEVMYGRETEKTTGRENCRKRRADIKSADKNKI